MFHNIAVRWSSPATRGRRCPDRAGYDPGVPGFDAARDAPGCCLRTTLDLLNAWLVAGALHSYTFAVPTTPSLVNVHLYKQAAVLQPGVNQLLGGTITSNGIDGKLGSL